MLSNIKACQSEATSQQRGILFRKDLQLKDRLFQDLKAFRSKVKGKHSVGGKFQCLAV